MFRSSGEIGSDSSDSDSVIRRTGLCRKYAIDESDESEDDIVHSNIGLHTTLIPGSQDDYELLSDEFEVKNSDSNSLQISSVSSESDSYVIQEAESLKESFSNDLITSGDENITLGGKLKIDESILDSSSSSDVICLDSHYTDVKSGDPDADGDLNQSVKSSNSVVLCNESEKPITESSPPYYLKTKCDENVKSSESNYSIPSYSCNSIDPSIHLKNPKKSPGVLVEGNEKTLKQSILKHEPNKGLGFVNKFEELTIKSEPKETQHFYQLKNEIELLTKEVMKLKTIMMNIDTSKLPDNGMKLQMKLQDSITLLKRKEREFSELPPEVVNQGDQKENIKSVVHRLPVGFGAKALETQVREKTLTEEALHNLHISISTCPTESVLAEDPLGLRSSVSLMPHQKHGLAWLLWRETQNPRAGILADDMGLGKTLTMISLVLKEKELSANKDIIDEELEDGYPRGGTLVVCPASLLHQWEDEVKKHCKRGILEVEIHHGSGREENGRALSKNDIVITTYSIVRTSAFKGGKDDSVSRRKRGVLHRVNWERIILDEAHGIRNHKSQQSVAVCLLAGVKRWALTGTPIHNKELDLYALLKFLRVSPFDDYNVWRRWVDNRNSAGIKRLNTVINAIMLRRTKSILQEKGDLATLPAKSMTEVEVQLDKSEYKVYTKVLLLSKTLFAQFLQQRAEKEQVMLGVPFFSKPSYLKNPNEENNPLKNCPELSNMFTKLCNMRDIKTHQILVLLLRLRQICCHPGLIKAMIEDDTKELGGIEDEDGEDIDLLAQLNKMSLQETHNECADESDMEILSIGNPVFNLNRESSKMKAVIKILENKVLNSPDKGIIVSQWTSMLNIIHDSLMERKIKCEVLTGAVPVKDRMEVVRKFNDANSNVKILLLSLTAGGVGLNLTGANHLFLVDLHWNPQLEAQAFDRIYRVGQNKDVSIYKFFCKETIEEKIKLLQEKKLVIAEGVLSGSVKRNVTKLTLDDIKTLFSM